MTRIVFDSPDLIVKYVDRSSCVPLANDESAVEVVFTTFVYAVERYVFPVATSTTFTFPVRSGSPAPSYASISRAIFLISTASPTAFKVYSARTVSDPPAAMLALGDADDFCTERVPCFILNQPVADAYPPLAKLVGATKYPLLDPFAFTS